MRSFIKWMRRNTGLAKRLGTFRPWDFILNREPLQGFLVLVTISPLTFFLLNWLMYDMWVPFSYQWYSALVGDVLLSLAGAIMLWQARRVPQVRRTRMWLRWVNNGILVGLCYGVAAGHVLSEHASIGSWYRHLGATSSYHNFFVYPLLGYTLFRLLGTTLKWGVISELRYIHSCCWNYHKPHYRNLIKQLAASVVVLACFYGWYRLGVYDGTHQLAPNGVDKHVYSSPADGWHNVRLLIEWVRHWF